MVSPSIAQGKMRGAADQQTCWRQLQSRQDVVRMQRGDTRDQEERAMARQDRQFPTYDVTSGQQRWKRYALVRWSGIVGVLIFSGLWLAACGEGGDNTGTNPSPPTTTTASRVSSAQASAQVA